MNGLFSRVTSQGFRSPGFSAVCLQDSSKSLMSKTKQMRVSNPMLAPEGAARPYITLLCRPVTIRFVHTCEGPNPFVNKYYGFTNLTDTLFGVKEIHDRQVDTSRLREEYPILGQLENAYGVRFAISEKVPEYQFKFFGLYPLGAKLLGKQPMKRYVLDVYTLGQISRVTGHDGGKETLANDMCNCVMSGEERPIIFSDFNVTPKGTFNLDGIGVGSNFRGQGLGYFGQLLIAVFAKAQGATIKDDFLRMYTMSGALSFSELPKPIDERISFLTKKLQGKLDAGIKPIPHDAEITFRLDSFGAN